MQDNYNTTESEEESYYESTNGNEILRNYDIPFEIRMKYIIKAYKKDQERWARFAVHAKQMEEKLSESRKTIKKLLDNNSELKRELKLYKTSKKKSSALESHMVSSLFSENKVDSFKSIIDSQNDYINQLQELLFKNNIAYPPQKLKK